MSAYDTLVARNVAYASRHPLGRPGVEPALRVVVLGCADHRADPAHVLGLAANDAVVIRNAGGRVTDGFLKILMVLATVALVEGLDPGFELILMQHTDCGLSHLSTADHGGVLAPMFGVEPARLAALHLDDPVSAIVHDVDLLRSNPLMPRTLVVGGLVYDVETGRVATIVEPEPLGHALS